MDAGGWAPERRRQRGAREHSNGDDEMVLRFKPAPPYLQARPTPVAGLREKNLASFRHNTTGQNIINIGPTQLLFGQLLCCVGSPQGPLSGVPGASLGGHFGEPFLVQVHNVVWSRMWRGRCGFWYLHVAQDCPAPQGAKKGSATTQHKRRPLVAKADRRLATCEEKRRAPRGARVPYADEIIGF